ncbi:MAG: SAM-dependent methyltransferase, partial [Acidobacteriota bacterium]|nr:SAM-dependent methyltransferase [Acidobacteriota bacterium]
MTRPRFLPLLIVLFIGSGGAALIYEIVWLQLLQLTMGSTAVSMAVLLGTFMGGMCTGSLALPRAVSGRTHPLRVYAVLELLSAIFGVAVLHALPLVSRLPRVAASVVCLLPPAIAMGATLPAITRWVRGPYAGILYGANVAGAVLGCLTAGFWLLRFFDMAVASYAAAALNVALAAVALVLSSIEKGDPAHEETSVHRPRDAEVYLAIGLSGLSALAAEAVWTRLLSLTLGPTVYTFSIILAVFLAGMGIGSWMAGAHRREAARNRALLAWSQAGLIPAIAWAAWAIADWLPSWDKDLSTAADPWRIFLFDLGCCAVAILPSAILWGLSFPLALGTVDGSPEAGSREVGELYAANTLGAISGAIGFSILAVPLLGSGGAERL